MLGQLVEDILHEVGCQHITNKRELKNYVSGYMKGIIAQKVNDYFWMREDEPDEILKIIDNSTNVYSAVAVIEKIEKVGLSTWKSRN